MVSFVATGAACVHETGRVSKWLTYRGMHGNPPNFFEDYVHWRLSDQLCSQSRAINLEWFSYISTSYRKGHLMKLRMKAINWECTKYQCGVQWFVGNLASEFYFEFWGEEHWLQWLEWWQSHIRYGWLYKFSSNITHRFMRKLASLSISNDFLGYFWLFHPPKSWSNCTIFYFVCIHLQSGLFWCLI